MPAAFFGPNPPFNLGETLQGKIGTGTSTDAQGAGVEGQIWLMSYIPLTRKQNSGRICNRPSLVLAVRNKTTVLTNPTGLTQPTFESTLQSTFPTYAGMIVAMKEDGTSCTANSSQISGLSATTLTEFTTNYPLDHLLVTLPAEDIGWVIVDGPALVATNVAAGDNDLESGERVVPSNTVQGYVEQFDHAAAIAANANTIAWNSVIGRCMGDIGDADSTVVPIIVNPCR